MKLVIVGGVAGGASAAAPQRGSRALAAGNARSDTGHARAIRGMLAAPG